MSEKDKKTERLLPILIDVLLQHIHSTFSLMTCKHDQIYNALSALHQQNERTIGRDIAFLCALLCSWVNDGVMWMTNTSDRV